MTDQLDPGTPSGGTRPVNRSGSTRSAPRIRSCSKRPSLRPPPIRASVLIEATSNQVDQFGGYTGMRPADFRELVFSIADQQGFPRDRIVLGGDHLGPNRWQEQPAEEAHGERRRPRRRLRRGRLHEDPPRLQHVVRRRPGAARGRPRRGAERPAAAASPRRPPAASGIERPPALRDRHRGAGARRRARDARRADPDLARRGPATLDGTARRSRTPASLDAWPRIIALVVQPGVEFDHLQVIDYRRDAHR